MKVVLASTNPGKINEFSALLKNHHIEVTPQSTYDVSEVPETGLSFIENAIIKARHAAEVTGLPAIGDDSGLCVPFLNGAPGIYTARYAGAGANATQNIQKLLADLKNAPVEARKAYFYCVLVLMLHGKDPTPLVCQGKWEGCIAEHPEGERGFGYDPIFYVPSEKKTAAQLPLDFKNKISHRGQALQSLMAQIAKKNESIDR